MTRAAPVSVLMVCTGNICRSPLAECILRHKASLRGVMERLRIDSAGVGDWHAGEPPDHRVREVAAVQGVAMSGQARAVIPDDLRRFDWLICMDRSHREHLLRLGADRARVRMLREFDPAADADDVPDPYYGGAEGFASVFDMIDAACEGLLDHLLAEGPGAR